MIGIETIIALLIGLLLGGLLNILIIRIPRERNLGGLPRCTRCGKPLQWWQVIPFIGWLLQIRGTSCCGKKLHWIHPLIEIITALMITLLYIRYGLTLSFIYLSIISLILILVGAIDWLHRWIYTYIVLGGALLALGAAVFVPHQNILNSFIGMLIAGFVFIIFFVAARALFPAKGVPFGLGDVYLALFIGAAYGFTRLTSVLFIGMLLAGVFSILIIIARSTGRNTPIYISYGTFLCIGALIYTLNNPF